MSVMTTQCCSTVCVQSIATFLYYACNKYVIHTNSNKHNTINKINSAIKKISLVKN